jgi:putative flippase GtrA
MARETDGRGRARRNQFPDFKALDLSLMAISEITTAAIAQDTASNTPRQGRRYLLIGGSQAMLNWGVFVLLTMNGVNVPLATVIGRLFAANFGFWINGYYTFSLRRLNPLHGLRFVLVWTFLTLLSVVLMTFVANRYGLHAAQLVKPVVSVLVACIGFPMWKYLVYRPGVP